VGENFFRPQCLPNFRVRDLKFFVPLEIYGTYLYFEFQDPIPKMGCGETIVEIKKFVFFFGKNGHISNQVTHETATRRQILSTACCSAIKKQNFGGFDIFLNFLT